MANERRGGRRQTPRPGGGGGGGYGEFRPYRGRPPRGAEESGGRDFVPSRGTRDARGARGYAPRSTDDGGMSIRVDPRRLSLLKELAGAEGLRPGQLVQRWVEERLDAERGGGTGRAGTTATTSILESSIRALESQLAMLAERIGSLEKRASAVQATASPVVAATTVEPVRRRRGRPPKDRSAEAASSVAPVTRRRGERAAAAGGKRIPLHEEIIAIIGERGPMSAAALAVTIKQRGRYAAPRSAKPVDAATVNSRVSNPVYRNRFIRAGGKIGLAG